jgi:hypothetical protein
MNECFVSFEGGPIIIGAAGSLTEWGGVESGDYGSLCDVFDADPTKKAIAVPKHEHQCIAVDFGGPGTVRIIRRGNGLALIRAWHEDPDSDAIYSEAVNAAQTGDSSNGEIEFESDTIAIAWAAESLIGIPKHVSKPLRPQIELAVDSSVILHPIVKGRYRWERSEIIVSSGVVVRLLLEPKVS